MEGQGGLPTSGTRDPASLSTRLPTKAVLLDLLMATMDSMSVWAQAAGGREKGLAWRDSVTERMVAAGQYLPYEALLSEAAAELQLDPAAVGRLRQAWLGMEPWPDVGALAMLSVPYAFVTNCSREFALAAVERSRLAPAFTLSAEEAGWYKPKAEIYRLAASRIGYDPRAIRFVAGAAYDAVGAHAAGLNACLVSRRSTSVVLPPEVPIVASLNAALFDE